MEESDMDTTKMSRRRQSGAVLEQTTPEDGHHPPASPYASASLVTLARQVIGTDSVRRWRFEQLRRGGYPAGDALVLSARSDVDLHQAIRLLRELCAVPTAMRILI
jgi:hypothetical protein